MISSNISNMPMVHVTRAAASSSAPSRSYGQTPHTHTGMVKRENHTQCQTKKGMGVLPPTSIIPALQHDSRLMARPNTPPKLKRCPGPWDKRYTHGSQITTGTPADRLMMPAGPRWLPAKDCQCSRKGQRAGRQPCIHALLAWQHRPTGLHACLLSKGQARHQREQSRKRDW